MAIIEIESPKGRYKDPSVYNSIIKYILKKETVKKNLVFTSGVSHNCAAQEMEKTAIDFHKDWGTRVRHVVLSFKAGEVEDALRAYLISKEVFSFYAGDYQYIGAIHVDTKNLHCHCIMNTVNMTTGKKYGGTRAEYYDFLSHAKRILTDYGLHLRHCT